MKKFKLKAWALFWLPVILLVSTLDAVLTWAFLSTESWRDAYGQWFKWWRDNLWLKYERSRFNGI